MQIGDEDRPLRRQAALHQRPRIGAECLVRHRQDHRLGGREPVGRGDLEAVDPLQASASHIGSWICRVQPNWRSSATSAATLLLRISAMSGLKVTPSTVTRGGTAMPPEAQARTSWRATKPGMSSLSLRPASTICA